jgi:hypothetical protein
MIANMIIVPITPVNQGGKAAKDLRANEMVVANGRVAIVMDVHFGKEGETDKDYTKGLVTVTLAFYAKENSMSESHTVPDTYEYQVFDIYADTSDHSKKKLGVK